MTYTVYYPFWPFIDYRLIEEYLDKNNIVFRAIGGVHQMTLNNTNVVAVIKFEIDCDENTITWIKLVFPKIKIESVK